MLSKQGKTFSHQHLLIAFHVAFTVGFSESFLEGGEERGGSPVFSRLAVLEGFSSLSLHNEQAFH